MTTPDRTSPSGLPVPKPKAFWPVAYFRAFVRAFVRTNLATYGRTEKGTNERNGKERQARTNERKPFVLSEWERNETQTQIRIVPILERVAKRKGRAVVHLSNYFHFLFVMSWNLYIRARYPYLSDSLKYFSSTFTYLLTLMNYLSSFASISYVLKHYILSRNTYFPAIISYQGIVYPISRRMFVMSKECPHRNGRPT